MRAGVPCCDALMEAPPAGAKTLPVWSGKGDRLLCRFFAEKCTGLTGPGGASAEARARTIRGRKVSEKHRVDIERQLKMIARDCGFPKLADISREAMEKWMNHQGKAGMAARTRNTYRAAIVAFCNWFVAERRLAAHPLAGLPKAEEAEPMRKRRALAEDKLTRLLKAAQERPLRDALTIRRAKNKGKLLAKVGKPERRRLRGVGRCRAPVYKFMMLTGLRRSEAASVTVNAPPQGGRRAANRPGRHAAQLAGTDDERLHRPAPAGRRRGGGRIAFLRQPPRWCRGRQPVGHSPRHLLHAAAPAGRCTSRTSSLERAQESAILGPACVREEEHLRTARQRPFRSRKSFPASWNA